MNLRFARGDAEELLLEAGNESVRPKHDLNVAAHAALERFALDRADEIDRHAVMVLGLRALGLVRVLSTLLGEPVERSVYVRVLDVGGETLKRNLGEIADFEDRQHFERDLEIEIAARLERRVDRRLVRGQLDLRLAGEAQMVVVDDLLIRVGDRLLDNVGHDRLAVDLAQMFDRHLSGTEAVDADFPLEVGQLPFSFSARSLAGREMSYSRLSPWLSVSVTCIVQSALSYYPDPLAGLPRVAKTSSNRPLFIKRVRRRHTSRRPRDWCGRRGSNPHDFRHRNLNPARLPIPPRPRRGPPQGALSQGALYIAFPPCAREKTTICGEVRPAAPNRAMRELARPAIPYLRGA